MVPSSLLLKSHLPFLLSAIPLLPSLSLFYSMLRAWKVPSVSMRSSMFSRAHVAGTVLQKVSDLQIPLACAPLYFPLPYFSVYSLSSTDVQFQWL